VIEIVPVDRENLSSGVMLCKELHDLGTLNVVPFDVAYAVKQGEDLMTNPNWFVRLAKSNGKFQGIMMGYVTPFMFSPKIMANESCLFVRQQAKERTKIGSKLVKEFVAWAKSKEAVLIQAGDIACIDSLAIDRFYRAMGFKRAGGIYVMETMT